MTTRSITQIALGELEHVYTFIYSRVGNRIDAEDLTLRVALRARPCLRGADASTVSRDSLLATARLALSEFWSARLDLAKDELLGNTDSWLPETTTPEDSREDMQRMLSPLSANYRRVLELRFVDGRPLREVALEMNTTVRALRVMQLCALRAAAKIGQRTAARFLCNDQQPGDTAFTLPDQVGGQPSLERQLDPRGGRPSA